MNRIITIHDIHEVQGQLEKSEMQTVAAVSGSENDYSIVYKEQSEEMEGCITTIHVTDRSCVTISREGKYTTQMKMQKGLRNQCSYVTPVGQIMMGIYTSRVVSEYSEKSIKLDFSYTLDCNNELVSKNRIKITVNGKEAE